jgi:hypothetical protein
MSRTQTTLAALFVTLAGLNACATMDTELDAVEMDMQAALQAGDYELAWQIAEDYAGTPFNAEDSSRPSRDEMVALMIGEYVPSPEGEGTIFRGRLLDAEDATTHIVRGERLAPMMDQDRGMMMAMTEAAADASMGNMQLDYASNPEGDIGRLRGVWMTDDAEVSTYVQGRWDATDTESGRFIAAVRNQPMPTWEDGIRIRVEISGLTAIVIKSDGLRFHHVEGAAPGVADIGEMGPEVRPANINGELWTPTWSVEGDTTDCDCDSDVFSPIDGATIDLTTGDTAVTHTYQGRGGVTVVEQPSLENEYQTVIVINDTDYAGPGWYEIELTLEAL